MIPAHVCVQVVLKLTTATSTFTCWSAEGEQNLFFFLFLFFLQQVLQGGNDLVVFLSD